MYGLYIRNLFSFYLTGTSRSTREKRIKGDISNINPNRCSFFHSTPLLHDSSVGNVPVRLRRPGLPRITPQAKESPFLAIIKGGRVGAKGSKVPTKIYFLTANLILKPLEQALGFSVQVNFASCCRLKDDNWWDGFQSWVLIYGGDFCFMFQEVFAVMVHNCR